MARKDGLDRGLMERQRGTRAQVEKVRARIEQLELLPKTKKAKASTELADLKKRLTDLLKTDWWVRWTDHEGKEHREKCGSKTLAKQLYTKRKEEARLGKKFEPKPKQVERFTIERLIDRYEPSILANNAKSEAEYRRQGKLWRKVLKGRQADELKAGEVEAWKTIRRTQVAASTVNLSLRYLKMLLNLALRDGLISINPLSQGRVKEVPENNSRDRVLEPSEEALLPAVLPRWLWLAVQLSLHTGLRQAELFHQKRRLVDLERRLYIIADAKGGGRQVVNLNTVASAALKELLTPDAESEWLFPNQFGTGPRDGTSVTKLFQRRCEGQGILNMTWHALRHTFISRLCMLGVPLPTVQKLARHKSITMTLRYAHLCPVHLLHSLDRLVVEFGLGACGTGKTVTGEPEQ